MNSISLGSDQKVFISIVSALSNMFFFKPSACPQMGHIPLKHKFHRSTCLLKYLCRVGERCLLPLPKQVHFGVKFGTEEKVSDLPRSWRNISLYFMIFLLKWRLESEELEQKEIPRISESMVENTQICREMDKILLVRSIRQHKNVFIIKLRWKYNFTINHLMFPAFKKSTFNHIRNFQDTILKAFNY